jgi:hypothetical protein
MIHHANKSAISPELYLSTPQCLSLGLAGYKSRTPRLS